MGLRTAHEGYVALRVLNDPLLGDTLAFPAPVQTAYVESLNANASSMLPLATAQLLLGGFLLVVSVVTLFGGIRRIGYCVQALLANLVLACVVYVVGEPVREALVQALTLVTEGLPASSAEIDPAELSGAYQWGFRLGLSLHVLATLGAVWALSRPSVRAFMAFAASTPRQS